jgi:hypothetical protein
MKKFLPLLALLFASSFISAQPTVIFTDDFESYNTTETIPAQTSNWGTWTGSTTNGEASFVSTTQAHSPTKSMKVINGNDMVYNFGGKTTGQWRTDFWMFVPTGKIGYVNMMHVFGSKWAFEIHFEGGVLTLDNGEETTHTYPENTWFHVTFDVNLDEDEAILDLNGTQLSAWPYSNLAAGGTWATPKLDVIDFYCDAATWEFYIDDFTFSNTVPPLVPPTIVISTDLINTVGADPVVLPIGNTGEEVLNFVTFAKYADPSVNGTLADGQMGYDGDNASAVGYGSSFVAYVASRMKNDITSAHVGQQIVSVDVFINDAPAGDGTITVYVWEKGGFIDPGTTTVLAEKTITPTVESWNTVTLTTPVTITGDEIWVGYKITVPVAVAGTSGYCIGVDNQPNVPKANYIKSGIAWGEWAGFSSTGNGNYSIRANVAGLGWPTWLTITPELSEVYGEDSDNLTLDFNTTGLASGTYNATAVVGCNDKTSEWNNIPVALTIGTGIDNTTKIGVMTYPNPATENLNVVADVNINSIAIYSITGQIVSKFNVNSTSTIINVSEMASGIYVMEITAGNSVVNSKFIVK